MSFDYTSDEDMLPANHLDDPRINDLPPDRELSARKLHYQVCKALGVIWLVEKIPFLEKKQWVKDIERPF